MMATQQIPLSLAQAPAPQADLDRKRLQKAAWKAYRGEFQPQLKVVSGQPDDNVLANFCGPIVDKGVSWLFGQEVKIAATDEAGKDDNDIQDFLDCLLGDADNKMSLLGDIGINGGVCGQAFVKLIPAQGNMKYPRVVVLDPMLVRIATLPDDCSLAIAYIIEYPAAGGAMQKRQIIALTDPNSDLDIMGNYDLADTWTITNYERKGQSQDNWTQVGEPQEWPYPFPPIFCCKNLPNPNESWGTPDLTPDLINQNKSLNFMLSNLSRIIKFHGHPKTWIKGVGAAQVNVDVDGVIYLQSDQAQLGTLTPMDNFAGILSFVTTLMSNIDQQSRIPAVALGRQETLPKLGNISGVALSLMFQPLIEKTMQKRCTYGCMIRQICRAALVLAGLIDVSDYEDYKIELHWPDLLPNDNLQAAQEAVIMQQLQVSMDTIYRSLGLDPADEMAKKQQEDAQQVTNFSRGQGLPPAANNPAQQQIQQQNQQDQKEEA